MAELSSFPWNTVNGINAAGIRGIFSGSAGTGVFYWGLGLFIRNNSLTKSG